MVRHIPSQPPCSTFPHIHRQSSRIFFEHVIPAICLFCAKFSTDYPAVHMEIILLCLHQAKQKNSTSAVANERLATFLNNTPHWKLPDRCSFAFAAVQCRASRQFLTADNDRRRHRCVRSLYIHIPRQRRKTREYRYLPRACAHFFCRQSIANARALARLLHYSERHSERGNGTPRPRQP